MKSRSLMCITAVAMFAMANSAQLPSQQIRYKLIDIPTLGAAGNVDCAECAQFINDPGVVVGGSGNDAFRWQDGVLTDLGPGHATSINARGWATGGFPNVAIDPLTGGQTEHAVLWKADHILDLGTLDHGVNSAGLYVNNAGEVVRCHRTRSVGFAHFERRRTSCWRCRDRVRNNRPKDWDEN